MMIITTYITLQLGIAILLANPIGSPLISLINFIAVYLLYLKVRPFIIQHIQNQKGFEKLVTILNDSTRNMFGAKYFGSFVDKQILATSKDAQNDDRSKDIAAYVGADFYLSLLVFAHAVTPALIITLLFF
ncbi:hypothetical protein OH460_08580 [Vibrio sp. Makdt]|uniref:hypothetical protein n=1 Tax=Vibrio sp. Makdt TaxID=2998828 RepID=UPI0022CD6B0E|nr:hypothetical protein [Vibrio sp. Makdt]MDA0152356.1 hypothetical protein [Vibrio sp. Makdt]